MSSKIPIDKVGVVGYCTIYRSRLRSFFLRTRPRNSTMPIVYDVRDILLSFNREGTCALIKLFLLMLTSFV